MKDQFFHDVYVRLYNCDYRAVTTAVVTVLKELQAPLRTEVTYGLRGIILFGLLKQLFDANFLKDYLDHARRKEGWCYIDRVLLTVLMNRSSYHRGIGESDLSIPYGLYNLIQDLKPLYEVKEILTSVIRCFLNHQQGWVHLVTVLNTNVDDREVFVTVTRLAKMFEEASKPGNAALRNELNRIQIRVNPGGFTLVRFILNHFEFYAHLVDNGMSLFEQPLAGERTADGRSNSQGRKNDCGSGRGGEGGRIACRGGGAIQGVGSGVFSMRKTRMRIVHDPEETAAMGDFARGVPLPLVTLHCERGELDHAAAIARLALGMDDCPDAAKIEEILERCSEPPAEWWLILDSFAGNPSLERWRELIDVGQRPGAFSGASGEGPVHDPPVPR